MAGDEGDRPDFVEDRREPLIDLESSDSTELWLIQWPHMQVSIMLFFLKN